jgi:catechol 2,3-dioxygenase-like lactoylglutathione lyase family enzyme
MNLNQVTLPALDIAESVEFYRRMGFVQIVASPHYARFECSEGGATFSVHAVETVPDNSATVIYFECDQLDERCAELRQRGFEFQEQPNDKDWLWREARLRDPSGNAICLYHAGENRRFPPWRIDSA